MKYIQRRILTYIIVFIAVINLVFHPSSARPGKCGGNSCGREQGSRRRRSSCSEIRFGLNQPVYVQYELYLKGIFATWPPDFGISFGYYPDTVTHLFIVRLPWTMLLILYEPRAFSFYGVRGCRRFSSLRRGGKFEAGAMYISILLNSTPIFWSAMVLLWFFAVSFKWFPQFGSVDDPSQLWTGLHRVSARRTRCSPIIALSLSIFGESYLLLAGIVAGSAPQRLRARCKIPRARQIGCSLPPTS